MCIADTHSPEICEVSNFVNAIGASRGVADVASPCFNAFRSVRGIDDGPFPTTLKIDKIIEALHHAPWPLGRSDQGMD